MADKIQYVNPSGLAKFKENVDKQIDGLMVELTKAEYEALSDEEKSNGTVYYVTDMDAIVDGLFFDSALNSLAFGSDYLPEEWSSSGSGFMTANGSQVATTTIAVANQATISLPKGSMIKMYDYSGSTYVERIVAQDYFEGDPSIIVTEPTTYKSYRQVYYKIYSAPSYNENINSLSHGLGCATSGKHSHAEGNNTMASGNASHAEGYNTIASGGSSHAEGCGTRSTGTYSHAEGYGTQSTGAYSHAEGYNTIAFLDYSHAEGIGAKAFGTTSHAEGSASYAYGIASHAEGDATTAIGNYSHSEGNGQTIVIGQGSFTKGSTSLPITITIGTITIYAGSRLAVYYAGKNYNYTVKTTITQASGDITIELRETIEMSFTGSVSLYNRGCAIGKYSHSEGYGTCAINFASASQGKFNAEMTAGGNGSNTTGTAFVIGNGTSGTALSNAFSVQYDGTTAAAGTITGSATADYAEFFEWLDGNANEEDRVGHFVTLDGTNIRYANSNDSYILGIVSGEPFVLGNGDCDVWNGMYLRDEFNRKILEPAPVMVLDEETNEYVPQLDEEGNIVYDGTRFKINPNYDYTQKYIPRRDRAEWAAVGMLGVLSVYDNGNCSVNGYCKCGDNGIAVSATTEEFLTNKFVYRVVERVNDNIIKVLLK